MSLLPDHDPVCHEAQSNDSVLLRIEARPRSVGSITVSRLLPVAQRRMVGPFTFLDHMGPVSIAPGAGFDVKPHPHIGLSTVTYFLAGENVHRDSLGSVQINRPGDVNIMTAGRGVVHSERAEPLFRERGGVMHGVQIWLALPTAREDDAPTFEHHPKASLPELAPGPGIEGRLLLGSAYGARSPVVHPSQPLLIDLTLQQNAMLMLPAGVPELAVFVISGEIAIGRQQAVANCMLVVGGEAVRVCATRDTRLLVLGGPALGPRLMRWNFVSSSQEALDRATQAWKAQTFPKIPGDDQEYVPLPEQFV